MALTNLEIRNAKPGMHADGQGLYLCVKPSGTKSWVFRFQLNKKRREMGIGSLAVLSAVEARAEAANLKRLVAEGIDPLAQREFAEAEKHAAEKSAALDRVQKAATFKLAAAQYIADQEASWRNPKHYQQWVDTLKTYADPVIGDLPVSEITPQHVIDVLRPIWSNKPETAFRALQDVILFSPGTGTSLYPI